MMMRFIKRRRRRRRCSSIIAIKMTQGRCKVFWSMATHLSKLRKSGR
jgi:hypothetical protein